MQSFTGRGGDWSNDGLLASDGSFYDLSYQGNNLTITKALLNVIADARTKVYGDADPALTYQVSSALVMVRLLPW